MGMHMMDHMEMVENTGMDMKDTMKKGIIMSKVVKAVAGAITDRSYYNERSLKNVSV